MGRVWVPKALDSDELTLKAQAKKYGVTAREIARVNEVPWQTEAINDWVIEAGGRMLESGYAVFEPGNVILLPGPPEGAGARREGEDARCGLAGGRQDQQERVAPGRDRRRARVHRLQEQAATVT